MSNLLLEFIYLILMGMLQAMQNNPALPIASVTWSQLSSEHLKQKIPELNKSWFKLRAILKNTMKSHAVQPHPLSGGYPIAVAHWSVIELPSWQPGQLPKYCVQAPRILL